MRAHWQLLRTLAVRAIREFLADRGPQLAAAIAFHVLFSLFPLLIVIGGVFAIVVQVTGLQADVVDAVVRHAPLTEEGEEELRQLLEGTTRGVSALGLLALPGLLWSASGMMAAIRIALSLAWDAEQTRPFLRGKLVDVGLVLAAALVVLLSGGLTLAARVAEGLPGFAVLLSLLAPLLLAFTVAAFLYRVVPATRPRLRDVWPGALLVALVFLALQNLFAVYVDNFGRYNVVYGSLGAVIAFLFFVYVSANVFLLGAELSSEWPQVREQRARLSRPEPGEKESMEPGRPDRGQPRAAPRARRRLGYGWAALVAGVLVAAFAMLLVWLV